MVSNNERQLDNLPPQVEALIKAYGRLKDELDSAAEISEENGQRQGMIAVLDAVRNFLLFDNDNMRNNRYRQILRHRARLLDLDRGITHEALKPSGAKAGRLDDSETELVKVIAIVLSDTHHALGASRSHADKEAIKGLASVGITQVGESGATRQGHITPQRLRSWRNWIGRQDPLAPFNSLNLYRNLTNAMASHRGAGTLGQFPERLMRFLDDSRNRG